jgi:toxin ParE1/3/4
VKPKPVVPRERANRDVDDIIAHYLAENAPKAALGFIQSL